MGVQGNPYQKLKTHRIWPTVFWEGSKITNKNLKKITKITKNTDLGPPTLELRGPNSSFRAPKSMREPTPELNGSLKDRMRVLKF